MIILCNTLNDMDFKDGAVKPDCLSSNSYFLLEQGLDSLHTHLNRPPVADLECISR